MKKFILIAALSVFAVSATAADGRDVHRCQNTHVWKSFGVGAAYGGAIGFIGSGLGIAFAPAGAVVAPVAVLAGSTIYGGLVGGGGALAGNIYHETVTGEPMFGGHCVRKVEASAAAKKVVAVQKRVGREVAAVKKQTVATAAVVQKQAVATAAVVQNQAVETTEAVQETTDATIAAMRVQLEAANKALLQKKEAAYADLVKKAEAAKQAADAAYANLTK